MKKKLKGTDLYEEDVAIWVDSLKQKMEEKKKEKLNMKQYNFVCSIIWGGSPIDTAWAIETPIYKLRSKEILEQYPNLDYDFFKK